MNTFIDALLQYSFLQHALIGGLLASIGCGIIGSYVVVKRIGFLAGGISHSVLGGIGVAFFYGLSPLGGALVAAVMAALLIGWVSMKWKEQEDTLIGALWAVGMAIGVIFISRTPGYNVNLMSYLFGNILMVPVDDAWLMAGMDLLILGTVSLFYRQFIAVSFDEEFARLRGVPVTFFYLLLLCMVAVTVVLLIQVVGLILVIALLTLPAAIAAQYVHSLGKMMVLATLLGMLFTVAGLAIAYEPDLPAGATIILVAGLSYLISVFVSAAWKRHQARQMLRV
ncbi:metal ABC transporter permease [Candidatus Vondammii sp. HM_W22]|uniref:metal ABC transporter permease n=1 Tax=Candidatus Vondammii sp. HM_W22 TaxID=2687299 RepID=UPI001F140B87|nr:metal ABC transporter permease [Candidatus Vondammii sp. HM_W22]